MVSPSGHARPAVRHYVKGEGRHDEGRDHLLRCLRAKHATMFGGLIPKRLEVEGVDILLLLQKPFQQRVGRAHPHLGLEQTTIFEERGEAMQHVGRMQTTKGDVGQDASDGVDGTELGQDGIAGQIDPMDVALGQTKVGVGVAVILIVIVSSIFLAVVILVDSLFIGKVVVMLVFIVAGVGASH